MNQLIEAKDFWLSPRFEGQVSLTVEMQLVTQPLRQNIRIWREDSQFTLVLQDARNSRNFRFYSYDADYEDNYTSVDFWSGTWPSIASGINKELEGTNEFIELETKPLILPSWVRLDCNQLALPENFCEF